MRCPGQVWAPLARSGQSGRFRWEYVPGSDLFVVYSDARDTQGAGFPRQANRSLAIKLTRLVRF